MELLKIEDKPVQYLQIDGVEIRVDVHKTVSYPTRIELFSGSGDSSLPSKLPDVIEVAGHKLYRFCRGRQAGVPVPLADVYKDIHGQPYVSYAADPWRALQGDKGGFDYLPPDRIWTLAEVVRFRLAVCPGYTPPPWAPQEEAGDVIRGLYD